MHVTHTEAEQIEQLKGWLKDYGPSFFIGAALALIIGFGWHYWQTKKIHAAYAASVDYSIVINDVAKNEFSAARRKAKDVMTDFPSTPYAAWSAMALAKIDVQENKLADANTHLQWVLDHTRDSTVKQTARLRLARVMIAQGKPADAINLLNTIDNDGYLGLVFSIKGDAYITQNAIAKAKAAYKKAIKAFDDNGLNPPKLLKMKLQNVGILKG